MLRRAGFRAALVLALLLGGVTFVPAVAAAPNDDALPGVPMRLFPTGVAGDVTPGTDVYDVYWLQLQRDEEIDLEWSGAAGATVWMYLLGPDATSVGDAPIVLSQSINGATAQMRHKVQPAQGPGRYYLVVKHQSGSAANYATSEASISTDRPLGKSAHGGQVNGFMTGISSDDMWTLWVERGRSLTINLLDPAGGTDDFRFMVFTDDGTQSPNMAPIKTDITSNDFSSVTINPGDWTAADYAPVYVLVYRASGSGDYTLWWLPEPDPGWDERITGADRFDVSRELETAVRWPADEHVSDVVVASGDDAAMADPLSAGGLCWAYNAPLLLVSKNRSANKEMMIRLADIRSFSGKVRVHVVGGPVTIPGDVYSDIEAAVGGAQYVERIGGANRYAVARNIALRMRDVRGDHMPGVLFANGADPDKFFDALSLSAVSASSGMPILLTGENTIPSETKSALTALATDTTPRYVAGGPATVSESVKNSLGAARWAGPDRYATAATVAQEAYTNAYIGRDNIAIAAKLPDALSAGSNVGFLRGPVLVVQTDKLPSSTRNYLLNQASECERLWPVGGPRSLEQSVIDQASAALD
jgi:putative cell wall-binding protein